MKTTRFPRNFRVSQCATPMKAGSPEMSAEEREGFDSKVLERVDA
jgi:hypothetical protein